jgi:hypothetical protein
VYLNLKEYITYIYMLYKCHLCKKEFKTKHGLKGHLEKKTPCVSSHTCKLCGRTFKTKQILEKHYKRKTPCTKDTKNKIIDDSKNIPKYSKIFQNLPIMELSTDSGADQEIQTLKPKCEYCNKEYSTKYNLNKHLKICKSKLLFENTQKELQLKYDKLKEDIEFIKQNGGGSNGGGSQIIHNNTENNITINSTINNTQNNINITINAFGDEMVDYLTEKEYRSAINSKIGGIVKMIKNINFNSAHPQNHNVYIPNKKDQYAMIYDGAKWLLNKKDDVIENLISNNYDRIINYYEENGKYLTNKEKKNMEKLNKVIMDGQPKQLQDSIFLVLYNNRDLITKDCLLGK